MLPSVSGPGFEIHGQGHPKIVYVQAYPYQGRGSYPQGAQPLAFRTPKRWWRNAGPDGQMIDRLGRAFQRLGIKRISRDAR